MAEVTLSPAAVEDYNAIIAELQQRAGTRIAQRYDAAIEAELRNIAEYPGSGAPRGRFGKLTRMALVSPYLIYYDGAPKAESVVVLRIVHGRRRFGRKQIDKGRT